jgi:two-component system chemotaxis response regulator CheB
MAHTPTRRVVVLGASAGGPLALGDVLESLPADLDAAVVVVLHLMANHRSLLAEVLARRTELPVVQARDGDPLVAGHVYVAPPDHHLTFRALDETIVLDTSAPRGHHRPSIDATLESAAETFGADTIAVVMTGTGSDGAQGARRVRARGGVLIAQQGAEYEAMPAAAIETGAVDQVLPLHAIAPAIVELIGVRA